MIVFQNSVVNTLKKRRIKYVCLSLIVSAMTCTFFATWNNAFGQNNLWECTWEIL